jgi:hypothetical protein
MTEDVSFESLMESSLTLVPVGLAVDDLRRLGH